MVTSDVSVVEALWTKYVSRRDTATKERLIMQYLPLVKYVVGRFPMSRTNVLSSDDLLSHGVIGLVQAVDRFDPTRGVKFETYAIARIRGSIIDGIRSLNGLGREAWQRAREIQGVLVRLEEQLGRPPTDEEAASSMRLDVDTFRKYLSDAGVTTVSLDGLLEFNGANGLSHRGNPLEDTDSASPETVAEKNELRERLRGAVRRLPDRDRLLLTLYYFEELTMKEISKVLNISESRVCQLHTRAVLRLRGYLLKQRP
ncbi:MAG: FliA/WhiG family RNA polymerase sigma factor [Chloroflexota bacterium]